MEKDNNFWNYRVGKIVRFDSVLPYLYTVCIEDVRKMAIQDEL